MSLNEKQQAAAKAAAEGVIRISAVAGSGKTHTLLHRIDHLYQQRPGNILFLAFNKSVVEELTVKVEKHVDVFASGFTKVATTYGFAYDLVKKHFGKLGMTEVPRVPPEFQAVKAAKEIATQLRIHLDETAIKGLLAAEAWRRGTGEKTYHMYLNRSETVRTALDRTSMDQLLTLMDRATKRRKTDNMCLFMDMIPWCLELPDEIFSALDLQHVLIDEGQDLHTDQHRLIHRLAKFTGSLTIVGDRNQTLYQFAGARPDLFDDIPKVFGAKDFDLDVNYRSKQPILDLANRLLALPEMDTHLRMKANGEQPGNPVQKYQKPNDIVFWLQSLLDSGVPPRDITILFRWRKDTFGLELQLASAGIPYHSTAGSFFDHEVPSDFLAYLRLLVGTPTEEIWTRVAKHRKFQPAKGIEEAWAMRPDAPWQHWPAAHFRNESQKHVWRDMKQHLDQLKKSIANAPPLATFDTLYVELLKKRWDDRVAGDVDEEEEYRLMVEAMRLILKNFGSGSELLAYVASRPEDAEGEGVLVSSVHKFKGLQSPYVGIWGCGNGTFPKKMTAEELRICYVAVTRPELELALFPHENFPDGGIMLELTPDPMGDMKDLFKL